MNNKRKFQWDVIASFMIKPYNNLEVELEFQEAVGCYTIFEAVWNYFKIMRLGMMLKQRYRNYEITLYRLKIYKYE